MPDPSPERMPADVAGAQPAEAGPLGEPRAGRGARASWRSSVYGATLALLLTGVWLIVSPVPFSYAEQLNPVICGILIVTLAVLQLLAGGSRAISAATAAIGLWLVASPIVFDEATPEMTNLIVLGGIVGILSLLIVATDEEGSRASRA